MEANASDISMLGGCEADNDCASTLFAGKTGLEKAKRLVTEYKTGKIEHMNPELWKAKKIVDSTLHPGKESWAWGGSTQFLGGH